MAEKEQEKPLAPATQRQRVTADDQYSFSTELKKHHRGRKYIICCGCTAAFLLIIVVVILVLIFTVFHVKDPVMRLNSLNIENLELVTRANLQPAANVTFLADVSVKNPNAVSFKFENATTTLYYDGVLVGEARTPSGTARARRTVRLNVTIEVAVERIMGVGRLPSDVAAGTLPVGTYSSINGRVKIMSFKKNFGVRLNCTMTFNIRNQAIENQNCRRNVSH